MAATLDIISGGRLELGLGAGWNEEDARAYGIDLHDSLKDRFDAFDEGCESIIGLLTKETTTFNGRFVQLPEARCEPKPVQPHPPICIGGTGERRTLRSVARFAQHWNFPGGDVDTFRRKVGVCRRGSRSRSRLPVTAAPRVGARADRGRARSAGDLTPDATVPRMSRTRILVAALVVALVALVAHPAGAGGSGGSGSGGSGSSGDRVQTTEFHVTLTSEGSTLQQVGKSGEITYGWNHLTGTAASDSGDIKVDMLGNVQYTEGSGPFFGFVTLRFASLSDVAFRMRGRAALQSDGSTDLKAKLRVIGGNGALIGVKGGGEFTGTRAAAVGSPIELDFTIRLRGLDFG